MEVEMAYSAQVQTYLPISQAEGRLLAVPKALVLAALLEEEVAMSNNQGVEVDLARVLRPVQTAQVQMAPAMMA